MQNQTHLRVLRSELFAMFRTSQRALDYSTKGYELASPEFCLHVRRADAEVQRLSHSIVRRAQELLHSGLLQAKDQHFVSFALKLGHALQMTYAAAARVAEMTMDRLARGSTVPSPETAAMGQEVNRSLRVCVVALFKGTAETANTVLAMTGRETTYAAGISQPCHGPASEGTCLSAAEAVIRKNLAYAAHQVFEMARAIVTWLETRHAIFADCESMPEAQAGARALPSRFVR